MRKLETVVFSQFSSLGRAKVSYLYPGEFKPQLSLFEI